MSNGAIYSQAQTTDPVNREKDDFYPTPPEATRALLSVERFDGGKVWEPACGDGAISKVLIEAGYDVISTDLVDRGYGEAPRDFLMEWNPRAPNIMTNPPFREAQLFIDRSLMLIGAYKGAVPPERRKVVVLLRLAFLEGVERGKWFPKTPLARVWIMSRRLRIQRGRQPEDDDGAGIIAFAWFVWELGHQGPPTLGFVDWAKM